VSDLSSVLLDDPTNLAPHLAAVAEVVADALKEHPTEARARVRYGSGIVVRDVPAATARGIVRRLAGLGLGAFLVPRERFKAASRARRVGTFRVGPAGLAIAPFLRREALVDYPWERVLGLHATALLDASASEEGEGLPRRGGNIKLLTPKTKALIHDIREVEERERVVVRLGLDVLLADGTLYRLGCDETGVYGSLDLRPLGPDERLVRPTPEVAGEAWREHEGVYAEWEGVVAEADPRPGRGRLRVRTKAGEELEVTLRRALDARVYDVTEGMPVELRGRIDGRDGDGALRLGDAELKRSTHSLENFVRLVRRLLQEAPASALVPSSTRRFAERASLEDVVYTKREELDAMNAWLIQADAAGVVLGEVEELPDDALVDADEAIVVGSDEEAVEDDVDDISDEELVDDEGSADETEAEEGADAGEAADAEAAAETAAAEAEAAEPAASGGEAELRLGHDTEIIRAMEHFDSGRFDVKHVRDLVSAAEDLDALDGLDSGIGEADDAELNEAMTFFDPKSGKWRISDVLAGQEDLDPDDLEAAEKEGGAGDEG